MVCIESALDTRNTYPIRGTAIRHGARSLKADAPPTGPDSRSFDVFVISNTINNDVQLPPRSRGLEL